jgi:hypothetical protein
LRDVARGPYAKPAAILATSVIVWYGVSDVLALKKKYNMDYQLCPVYNAITKEVNFAPVTNIPFGDTGVWLQPARTHALTMLLCCCCLAVKRVRSRHLEAGGEWEGADVALSKFLDQPYFKLYDDELLRLNVPYNNNIPVEKAVDSGFGVLSCPIDGVLHCWLQSTRSHTHSLTPHSHAHTTTPHTPLLLLPLRPLLLLPLLWAACSHSHGPCRVWRTIFAQAIIDKAHQWEQR